MLRPFLSLVVAAVATALGLALGLTGATQRSMGISRLAPEASADAATLLGTVLLGVAAASLVIHWVGALVIGAIHVLLGGLAVLVPTGGLLSGAYSPVFEITGMLSDVDERLGQGSLVFYVSGTALVLGAFLVAAALGVRTRLDRGPSGSGAVVVATVVAIVVLGTAVVLVATVGSDFATRLVVMLRYEVAPALGIAGAAVLAGVGGLTLRWSSLGAILIGALTLAVGLVAFFAWQMLPAPVLRSLVVGYGLLLVLGASMLGAACAATKRARHAVPDEAPAL